MSEKPWLDELPLDSRERQLLAAGKAARPPEGAVDRDWQALRIALAGSAAVSVVATSKAAASAAPAASAAAKATSAGLGIVYAKSVALGCVVALGVLGGGSLLQQLSRPAAAPASDGKAAAPQRRAERPSELGPRNPSAAAKSPEPAVADAAPKKSKSLPPESTSAQPAARSGGPESSLAEQARDLAQIKRLLDAGATSSALRRLEASFADHARGQLSEERDALYVQALERSGRSAQAQQLARQFVTRYPNSPQAEKMRALSAEAR